MQHPRLEALLAREAAALAHVVWCRVCQRLLALYANSSGVRPRNRSRNRA